MFTIKLAGIYIQIINRHSYVEKICSDYVVENSKYDFSVFASDDDIEKEKAVLSFDFSDGYIESVCIYRNIANQLPNFNALVFHSASLEYKGSGYCFTAKSGTGKTTHMKLWRKYFGKEVLPINGDKPIIRLIDKTFYVCGTPWSGKEQFDRNVMVPLKGICVINQSKTNNISRLELHDTLNKLLPQIYIPNNQDLTNKTIDLLGSLISKIPTYLLECDISSEAAYMSFNKLVSDS